MQPQPNLKLIKPADGMMIDPEKNLDEFIGIETQVKPEIFYNFLSLPKTDIFGTHRTSFTISNHHYTIMEHIRTKLVRAKKLEMARALVALGCISTMKLKNKSPKKIKVLIKTHKDYRERENMIKLEHSLSRLNLENKEARKYLLNVLKVHGKNKYGTAVLAKIYNHWDKPELKFKETDIVDIPYKLKSWCKELTKQPLTRSKFELKPTKRNSEKPNQKLDLYISDRIPIITHEYLISESEDNLQGFFFRAFLITGLYCLSKWILAGNICKEEYGFYHILDKVDSYASSI